MGEFEPCVWVEEPDDRGDESEHEDLEDRILAETSSLTSATPGDVGTDEDRAPYPLFAVKQYKEYKPHASVQDM